MAATVPDPRVNAYRPDIADARLRGQVDSALFVEGALRRVAAPAEPLRAVASPDAAYDSELIHGEVFRVFGDTGDGWAWGQCETDGYVGFVRARALGPPAPVPTHRISALRTFVYAKPDMKLPPVGALSIGARIAVAGKDEARGTPFLLLHGTGRAIPAVHAVPIDAPPEGDYVAVAERFMHVPYLWGGRTAFGLDCSALVQLALMVAGTRAPRDTDMQREALGVTVPGGLEASLHRGDLVFWPSHVAILTAPDRIVHASGHHMAVVAEPLAEAAQRIGALKGPALCVRRVRTGGLPPDDVRHQVSSPEESP